MFWAAWALFVTALYAVACVLASRRLPLEPPLWADAPPVSVIKPVRGLDPGAEANFRSFFRQRYPSAFELIFACESEDDPAVPLLRRLMEEHPEVPARLVLAPPRRAAVAGRSRLPARAGVAARGRQGGPGGHAARLHRRRWAARRGPAGVCPPVCPVLGGGHRRRPAAREVRRRQPGHAAGPGRGPGRLRGAG